MSAQPATRRKISCEPHVRRDRPGRRNQRLPNRGVRPGPARFEILVTTMFILTMVAAVVAGGPTDLTQAVAIAVPYFLLGLLVVRRELFAVVVFPIALSLFFTNQSSHELRLENPQVVYWLAGVLFWAPALIFGYLVRKKFDGV